MVNGDQALLQVCHLKICSVHLDIRMCQFGEGRIKHTSEHGLKSWLWIVSPIPSRKEQRTRSLTQVRECLICDHRLRDGNFRASWRKTLHKTTHLSEAPKLVTWTSCKCSEKYQIPTGILPRRSIISDLGLMSPSQTTCARVTKSVSSLFISEAEMDGSGSRLGKLLYIANGPLGHKRFCMVKGHIVISTSWKLKMTIAKRTPRRKMV